MFSEIVSIISIFVSAFVAYAVSHHTTAAEFKKMRLEWEREDKISSDDEFAEMAAAVAAFNRRNVHSSAEHLSEASARVAAIRAKEQGRIAELADELYLLIHPAWDREKVDNALSAIIIEKRKQDCSNKRKN